MCVQVWCANLKRKKKYVWWINDSIIVLSAPCLIPSVHEMDCLGKETVLVSGRSGAQSSVESTRWLTVQIGSSLDGRGPEWFFEYFPPMQVNGAQHGAFLTNPKSIFRQLQSNPNNPSQQIRVFFSGTMSHFQSNIKNYILFFLNVYILTNVREDSFLLAGVVWITLKLPKYGFWTIK